ncbi:ADP-ribosylation factor-like 10 isoform X1 [Hippocampus comes]|uniref:ADP-ribosylation factor-like 10 isoform X1 n=1 Tax=Hippocampus comes TaxID=109280 RepID=UPI00094F294F|nr:PREDICTED: ADP-ribosylation factor-like protein 9 isoform X1 [Hippocampus comes]XP_019723575.1 PREDICTED: ADP-ribosylation factor-like protein 9 isoform X1 [Hippocampus comes]
MVLLRHISVALTAAMVTLGSAIFIALNYFYPRRTWSPHAQYATIKEEKEDPRKRQVLVLGLDGAGKSSVLQGLTPGGAKRGRCRPTRGFNFISLSAPACQLDFLEIGGGEDLRPYWLEYLIRTHVLVYVVDSSDRGRLPLAKLELHRLLRVQPQLPVVVLGNKQVRIKSSCKVKIKLHGWCDRARVCVSYQDKPDAVSVSELHEALSLGSVVEDRKLFLLAAQLGSDSALRNSCRGLDTFQDLLLQLV